MDRIRIMEDGWTLRHRKRWSHKYYDDILLIAMIEYFIDHAAFKDMIVEVGDPLRAVKIKRGQCLYSQRELAKRFKIDRLRIRRKQGFLEKAEFLNHQTNQGYTLVTILNYDKYQAAPKASEPPGEPLANHSPNHHPLNKYNKYNKGGEKNADQKAKDNADKAALDRIRKTEKDYQEKLRLENLATKAKVDHSLKDRLEAKAKEHETKY